MNNDISFENKPFNVLVLGQLTSGKSTLINALLGRFARSVSITAQIPVVSEIWYGSNENQTLVYESGSSLPRMLSPECIVEELVLSMEELEIIGTGGCVYRLDRIDRIVFQCSSPMLKNGVRLIRVSDLEYRPLYSRVVCGLIPNANAIIFTLNAVALFSAAERKCINDNFVGKGLRNVFFVVNRIDNLVTPDELDKVVKPAVRTHLEGVFTDENGRFDEELFNKRVFYTNAYGALCVRTGEPYTVLVGRKVVSVDIEMEETGMPEFEQALWEFRREQQEHLNRLVRLSRMMQGRRGI